MFEMKKFYNALFAAGLILLFAFFAPLAAQTANKRAPEIAASVEAAEKLGAAQIKKVPVQLQLPSALAKMVGATPVQKVASPASGLVTIMSEDFEGSFPSGLWNTGSGNYTWAKRNCVAHNGSSSAWMIGGGTVGSGLACGANYPDNISTVMVYGPFDLSDANYAAFSFWVLLNAETNFDFFSFLASEDGTNFSGFRLSGTTNGAWIPFTQALTAVPTSGVFKNLAGKPAVWIAFAFSSDGSNNKPNGALVDDIVLQKGMVNAPTVASSFSSPGPSPRGLAVDGTNLFCSDATNDRIYKLTTTGSTISSYVSPGSISTGLAWDGTNLWNADLNNEKIYQLDANGAVLSSFSTPGQFPTGLAWHGSGFWLCDSDVPTIWKLNASGSVLSSFSATGTFHYGLAWDGQNLWLADSETLLIYKMDPAGNVLDYYLAPGTNSTGLAWDGTNLWAADRNTDLIYKLQVAPTQRFAKDLGATALQLPVSVDLGNSIPIKLVVRNFGTDEQSNFAVGYRINNGPAVAENFSSPLPAGASATHTFATPWVPAVVGTYRFTAWTALAGDENAQNDTLPTPSQVVVQFAKDLGVTALQVPVSVFLGNSVSIEMIMKNFGSTEQSNFSVSYLINSGPAVTENFTGTLATGATATKTFAAQWTPAAVGNYRLAVWTALAGDQNPANDTLSQQVEVIKPDPHTVSIMLQAPTPQTRARFGWSVLMADLNGDGRAEAITGSIGATVNGEPEAGQVFVYFGPAYSSSPLIINDPQPERFASFGGALAASDLNGDGIQDLIVGARFSDIGSTSSAGEVFVFLGGRTFDAISDFTLRDPVPESNDDFGTSLATGDINGDGMDDLVVGADDSGNGGEAFVFLGGNAFNTASDFTLKYPGSETFALFGAGAAIGEVNGDGIKDIILTAPFADVGGVSNAGQVVVFLGGASFDTNADFTLNPPPNTVFRSDIGTSITTGDINGDHLDDVMIGSFGRGSNTATGEEVLIYFGASPFNNSIDATLVNPTPESGNRFAPALACGDVNGDNVKDIVMGIDGLSVNALKGAGKVFIFHGGSSFDITVDKILQDPNPEFRADFGNAVAIDNRKGDILVGAGGSAIFTTGQRDFYGFTDDGYIVSFNLTPDGTAIEPFSLNFFGFSSNFDFETWTTNYPMLPITNNRINFFRSNDNLQGTFTTPDLLQGTVSSNRFINGQFFQSDRLNFFAKRGGHAGQSFIFLNEMSTGVQAKGDIPREFSLSQNYPNPFNPMTTIEYTLPQPAHVELKVYDLQGREVQRLVNDRKERGKYSVQFNAANLPSGVYFYQLRAGEFIATKKLILLR